MDEPLQEFEAELKILAPRRVSPRLANRIADEMAVSVVKSPGARKNGATSVNHFIAWRWMYFGAVGLAASIAVVVAIVRSPRSGDFVGLSAPVAGATKLIPTGEGPVESPISKDAYKPVAAANVLYEMKAEGPVVVKGENSERRVRYRYVDTYTWKNPRNNASITWSVPRDEIRVQPVQFN